VLSKNLPRYIFVLLSLLLLAEGLTMNFGYIRGYAFGSGGDLDQDYCAAKALLQGKSIYGDLSVICDTAKQRNRPELENFHPPVTTLLLLPFVAAGISIQHMFFLWGMAWVLVYAVVIHRAMSFFGIAPHLRWVLLGFALLWFPHLSQSMNGQFSTAILALVFLGWQWLRDGRDDAGGAALGAATAIKLFPGLLGVYLLATRRYRALAAMAGAFVAIQALAYFVVGHADFIHFYTHVMPEDSRRYASVWMNQSFTGTMVALLQPNPHFQNVLDWPTLGPVLVYGIALALVAHAARLTWRSGGGDHSYWHFVALAVILCPVSWDHTVVVMAPLCVLLLARFGSANKQELMFVVAGLMVLAQVDDLTYVREVIEKVPKIPLGGLWQARAQLWASLGITMISAALLSFPQLAERKSKKAMERKPFRKRDHCPEVEVQNHRQDSQDVRCL